MAAVDQKFGFLSFQQKIKGTASQSHKFTLFLKKKMISIIKMQFNFVDT